jgi:hypothetical protein
MANILSGADAYAAIEKEWIMLDFVFCGGKREGSVVYAVSGVGAVLGMPFGEI